MSRASAKSVLEAAAKVLAWELFAAAGYCRTRSFVDIDKFERELFSAARQWRAAHANLTKERKGKDGKTKSQ